MSTPRQSLAHYLSETFRWVYVDTALMAGHSARLVAQYAFREHPELREE